MGMQSANLQNLPENYVMKFCAHLESVHTRARMTDRELSRDLPCHDMATDLVCG